MPYDPVYHEEGPTREEIDQSSGPMVLEFGANWCGHCQSLSPTVEALLSNAPDVRHVRIADGRGKKLGRSFRVKLWPTLVFLRDGQVVSQLVRPTDAEARRGFEELIAS
ncbi:thioredoxin family protein [Candidatus Laterigemmans baculatus]|uniref:thioredoxin family protein n=1 Tax=Candidatus Laterigemmans baculatus TaxID=2770505 RepID=UPI0013DC1407|nr:thioredoxin family protein [Candidatus Laterigemmans baculatus]